MQVPQGLYRVTVAGCDRAQKPATRCGQGRVIAEAGEVPPASNHIPANTRTCRTSPEIGRTCPGPSKMTRDQMERGPLTGIDRPLGSRYADAMARRDLIAEKLTKAFAPANIDVVDESHRHAGHAGHREGGETHFRVHIVAEAFRGRSRLERHRMINETLVGELEGGIHALAIHASAPGEGGA